MIFFLRIQDSSPAERAVNSVKAHRVNRAGRHWEIGKGCFFLKKRPLFALTCLGQESEREEGRKGSQERTKLCVPVFIHISGKYKQRTKHDVTRHNVCSNF